MINKDKEFDFEYWSELAKQDPAKFEEQRKQVVDNYISTIPSEVTQDRMRRLQWRVNRERELAKNPMDATVRIYDMMWDSVGKNLDALQDLAELLAGNHLQHPRVFKESQAATILPFRSHTGTQG